MRNKYDQIMDRIRFRYIRGAGSLRDGQLEELEKAIGYSLPPDYRTFLSKYGITAGDGETRYGQLDNPDEEEEASVKVFYGILPGDGYDLLRIHEGFADLLPSHLLPIASSPGGQIVLSLAGPDAGRLYWWTPHRGSPDPHDDLIPIAYDFDTFMRSLRLHDEE